MRLLVNGAPLLWPACGSRTYLVELLTELISQGHAPDLQVLLPRGHLGWRRDHVPTIAPGSADVVPLRRAWLWEQLTLTSLPRRGGILMTPYVAPNFRGPQSVTLLDVIPWLDATAAGLTAATRSLRPLLARNLRRAELVIAISETVRLQAIDLLAVSPERVVSVPLAAGRAFGPQPKELVARVLAACGLHDDFVIWAGGYGPRKRPDLLLRAVKQARMPIRVVLVGDPPAALRAHADVQTSVLPRVTTEDLAVLYAASAAAVYLSEYEGFGLPPVEAAACGTRVVSSNLPSVRESLGPAATYAAELSAEAVADALASALSRPRPSPLRKRTWPEVAKETWDAHVMRWPDT